MHVLYITRDPATRKKVRKRMQRLLGGRVDGPEGFFEAALHDVCRVTRMTYGAALEMSDSRRARFDAVIVNSRSGLPWMEDTAGSVRALEKFPQPVSLFISHDTAESMAEDALLDRCKVVFKREPFADLDRYRVSAANAAKIVPTHLTNPMVSMSHRFRWRNRVHPLKDPAWKAPPRHDVFFIGTVNYNRHRERIAVWEAVRASGLDHVGGLLPKRDFAASVDPALVTRPMPRAEYLDVMKHSRINLALEGIGPFTFRHLEQLWAGAFTLSTPKIRELWLRAPLVEGQDYVAFDTPDDMIEKARHYIDADAERIAIARNGRAAYERLYDVAAHGREILAALSA